MSNEEILDICDENGGPAGQAARAQAHARGLWHRTAHVWVIVPPLDDEGHGALLFQRRSPAKDVAPNLLDVSVGGHLALGEEPMQAARRELEEELGIRSANRLYPLGARQTAGIYGSALDREIQTIFGIEDDRPLCAYRPQASEIASLVLIPIDGGLRLFSGEVGALSCAAARVLRDGSLALEEERIVREDFIPSLDGYFYRAFAVARRWLRGEDHLVI